MDKEIILAVAGAGKTYTLCKKIDINKSNLILSFTHRNLNNIRKELILRHGDIPSKTYIKTFDSFLLSHFIKPYLSIIRTHFNNDKIDIDGVNLNEPPRQRIDGKQNYAYIKDSLEGHYFVNNILYVRHFAKLIVKTKKKGKQGYNLLNTAINNFKLFYDNIYVDEFQDFREYNFDIIKTMIKLFPNIFLVGDFYQHSLAGSNNTGRPFKDLNYEQYLEEISKMKIKVDHESLNKSRRCSKNITSFINNKLKININSKEINEGEIHFISDENKIIEILNDDKIVKLVNSNSGSYTFNALNWSYSKGDTLEKTCVILTDVYKDIDKNSFNCTGFSEISINKLYVALTRSKSDVYIIKREDFIKVENDYKRDTGQEIKLKSKEPIIEWNVLKTSNGDDYYRKAYKNKQITVFVNNQGKYKLALIEGRGTYHNTFDTLDDAEKFFKDQFNKSL